MPYAYIPDIATADVAFDATGATAEEVFAAAADATINVMVDDLESIVHETDVAVDLTNPELDLLLFDFLNEIVYFKDARQLLLRPSNLKIENDGDSWHLTGQFFGERLDMERHPLLVDVKAVTLHLFDLRQTPDGWRARVVLDI